MPERCTTSQPCLPDCTGSPCLRYTPPARGTASHWEELVRRDDVLGAMLRAKLDSQDYTRMREALLDIKGVTAAKNKALGTFMATHVARDGSRVQLLDQNLQVQISGRFLGAMRYRIESGDEFVRPAYEWRALFTAIKGSKTYGD